MLSIFRKAMRSVGGREVVFAMMFLCGSCLNALPAFFEGLAEEYAPPWVQEKRVKQDKAFQQEDQIKELFASMAQYGEAYGLSDREIWEVALGKVWGFCKARARYDSPIFEWIQFDDELESKLVSQGIKNKIMSEIPLNLEETEGVWRNFLGKCPDDELVVLKDYGKYFSPETKDLVIFSEEKLDRVAVRFFEKFISVSEEWGKQYDLERAESLEIVFVVALNEVRDFVEYRLPTFSKPLAKKLEAKDWREIMKSSKQFIESHRAKGLELAYLHQYAKSLYMAEKKMFKSIDKMCTRNYVKFCAIKRARKAYN